MQPDPSVFDLFISYRHSVESDHKAVQTLAEQLRHKGLHVFMDESSIHTFDSITRTIQRDLSRCKALLVYLTRDYLSSRACVWELTAAFIASQKLGLPSERIFIVNSSDATDQLKKLPIEPQDAKYAHSVDVALEAIPSRLENISGTFQDIGPLIAPRPIGRTLTGSNRFAGRLTEMWTIHSNLNASACTLVTAGHTGPDIAQVSGMGGIGKTLLAEEYALRFGAAYPGGIYWLEAHGSFNPLRPDVETFKIACRDQYLKVLNGLGQTPPPDTPFGAIQAAVARHMEKAGGRCLWIVDDMPFGLSEHLKLVKDWLAPHPLACTLVTTRSREYTAMGKELPLEVLEDAAALDLLKNHGIDLSDQKDAAATLIERLGGHAMALDIAGAVIAGDDGRIESYLSEIDQDMQELIDVSPDLIGVLPSGHERSIVATYRHSLLKLSDPGRDYLRLASHLSPAGISNALAQQVFQLTDELEETEAKKIRRQAVAACTKLSLAKKAGDVHHQVHALTCAVVQHLGWSADQRGIHLRNSAIDALKTILEPEMTYDQAVKITAELEHARHLTSASIGETELRLLYQLASFDYSRGNFSLALESYQRILALEQENKRPEHLRTLTTMNNLAETLRAMGDHHGAKSLENRCSY